MKRTSRGRRGAPEAGLAPAPPPEKVGWIRKFCGRGIFREIWRSRFLVLRGDLLFISDKEVRDERRAQEVVDLVEYERCEELRRSKGRSKKDHSRFTLLRRRQQGAAVPNLLFLAVSPEEKESWINALNVGVTKAKNRILDEVTIEEDSVLVHPTRDRVKIPPGRRLPTRGHLMAVASTSSHGTLTLDLVAEEDAAAAEEPWEKVFGAGPQGGGRQRAGTDVSKLRSGTKEPKVKTGSLPRGSERSWGKHLETPKVHKTPQLQVLQTQSRTPQPGKRFSTQGRSRCASMDEVLSSRPAMIRSELRSALRRCPTEEPAAAAAEQTSEPPLGQLQSLIAQRMQRAQELLEEMRLQELQKEKERGGGSPFRKGLDSPRIQRLRGSDSPHSSRSSGSPRSRSGSSPRPRGRDSPRSRARRARVRGTDSPRSRGSPSPGPPRSDSSPDAETPAEDPPPPAGPASAPPPAEEERRRAEAERLLQEAVSSWKEAQEVLQEVKELQSHTLRRQRRRTYQKMAAAAGEEEEEEEAAPPRSPTSPEDETP